MATSGVYSSFAPTVADLISEASERAGMDPAALSHKHLVSAKNSLNYLTLEIATEDADRVYAIDSETATLADGTASFSLASGSIDIIDETVSITADGETSAISMSRISRDDYYLIPDLTTEGAPSQFFVDQSVLDAPLVRLWPVSDGVYTVTYDRMRFVMDTTSLSETPDVRRIWLDTLAWGLAARLAFKFNPERFDKCQALYDKAHALAKMESRGRTAIIMAGRGFGHARRRRI